MLILLWTGFTPLSSEQGRAWNLKLVLWKANAVFLGHCIYCVTVVVVSTGCNWRVFLVKDFVVLIHADNMQQWKSLLVVTRKNFLSRLIKIRLFDISETISTSEQLHLHFFRLLWSLAPSQHRVLVVITMLVTWVWAGGWLGT